MAINPGSLESHGRWAEKFGFDFPIAVDSDKKVAATYGVLGMVGNVQRTVFVVSKQGRVAWVKEGMPSTDEILQAIDLMSEDDPDSTRLSSS